MAMVAPELGSTDARRHTLVADDILPKCEELTADVFAIRVEGVESGAEGLETSVRVKVFLPHGVATDSLWVARLPYTVDSNGVRGTKRRVIEDRDDAVYYWDTFHSPWVKARVAEGRSDVEVVFEKEPVGERIYVASCKDSSFPPQLADKQRALVAFSQPLRVPGSRGSDHELLAKAECYVALREPGPAAGAKRSLRGVPATQWDKHLLKEDAPRVQLVAAGAADAAPAAVPRKRIKAEPATVGDAWNSLRQSPGGACGGDDDDDDVPMAPDCCVVVIGDSDEEGWPAVEVAADQSPAVAAAAVPGAPCKIVMPAAAAPSAAWTVCTTGLDDDVKKRVAAAVGSLGGRYSGNLTREVTHLVATDWGSAKYKKAVELGLEIVRPDWVYACEKAAGADGAGGGGVGAEMPSPGDFRPKYFDGYHVTVSGTLEREERETLRKEVEGAGGVWLPALNSETNPLAVLKPQGGKYDAAVAAGMSIVSLRWVWACVEERCRVDLGVYLPHADDEVPPFRSGWRGAWLPTSASAGAAPATKSVQNAGAPLSGPGAAGSGLPEARAAPSRGAGAPRGPAPAPAEPVSTTDPADLITIDVDAATVQGHYLDSCQIHPVGFEKNEMRSIVKLIRKGGGTRLTQPDNQVTHIVASVCAPLDGLTHLRAKIVTVSWLVESCKAGKVVATEAHGIFKQARRAPIAGAGAGGARRPSPVNLDGGSSLSTMFAGSRSAMTARPAPEAAVVEETRYAYPAERTSPREGGKGRSSADTSSSSRPRRSKKQLVGMKFTLSHALSETETQKAKRVITEHGGTISQSAADGLGSGAGAGQTDKLYAICPHGQSTNTFGLPASASCSPGASDSSSSAGKGKLNVTLQWVEDCCHRSMKPEQFADPAADPAFMPLPFQLPLKGAEKCVVCVSGFQGASRRRIRVLLKLLGAEDGERLSKQTTTMLVCLKPEGPKYESAINWGVPVVTMEWLHESARKGKLINHDSGIDLLACATEDKAPPGEPATDLAAAVAEAAQIIKGENTNTSAAEVAAEQDVITTSQRESTKRPEKRREEDAIEQSGAAAAAASGRSSGRSSSRSQRNRRLSSGGSSERRGTAQGSSQPLPLQTSASVTALLPAASQGSAKQAAKVEHENQSREADDAAGDMIGGTTADDAEQKQSTGNVGASKPDSPGTTHMLLDASDSDTALKIDASTEDQPVESDAVSQSTNAATEQDQEQELSGEAKAAAGADGHLQGKDEQPESVLEPVAADPQPHDAGAEETPLEEASGAAAAAESPKRDLIHKLKRSVSESQVTDSGGKENIKNITVEDSAVDVGRPSSAPEVPSEPISSAPAPSSSTQQRQKPDLSLLVKDFKLKFQKKKVETPREVPMLPPPVPSEAASNSGDQPRLVTRSEVERDTTDRPSGRNDTKRRQGGLNEDETGEPGPKRMSRRRGVEAATASEVRNRLTARKGQQQASVGSILPIESAATLGMGGMSDDEDMYAESQMVVYDRSAGGFDAPTAAHGGHGHGSLGSAMLPPQRRSPAAAGPPKKKRSPVPQTRRSARGSAAAADENETMAPPQDQTARVFQISGLDQKAKRVVTQDIKSLGGVVSTRSQWDTKCTHLITDEVKRVEKTLAACASGAWVVTVAYITASLKAKRFLDEAAYEHGAGDSNVDQLRRSSRGGNDDAPAPRKDDLTPDAPRRCREMLAKNQPSLKAGLFTGMRALTILADKKKVSIVLNVLKGGGAEVDVVSSGKPAPSAAQLKAATAIFTDMARVDEMKAQVGDRIRVYSSDSLSTLLSKGNIDESDGLFAL